MSRLKVQPQSGKYPRDETLTRVMTLTPTAVIGSIDLALTFSARLLRTHYLFRDLAVFA
ncbi:hypothetical protein J6590_019764 [Homalodisca vitripennis]|nr:hypothetical protein J6590_019764 [Homalodisca vitripennis]